MRARCAGDGLDEAARERGDAGEPLEEIERDALGGEDRADGAADFEHGLPAGEARAGAAHDAHAELRIDAAENLRGRLHARGDGGFLGKNARAARARCRRNNAM